VVLLPYFERAFPATALIALSASCVAAEVLVLRYFDVRPLLIWFVPILGLLALAVTATLRGWPWPLLLVLNAAWPLSLILLTVLVNMGVLTIQFYGPG
jgi:hypothetical protein